MSESVSNSELTSLNASVVENLASYVFGLWKESLNEEPKKLQGNRIPLKFLLLAILWANLKQIVQVCKDLNQNPVVARQQCLCSTKTLLWMWGQGQIVLWWLTHLFCSNQYKRCFSMISRARRLISDRQDEIKDLIKMVTRSLLLFLRLEVT